MKMDKQIMFKGQISLKILVVLLILIFRSFGIVSIKEFMLKVFYFNFFT